MPASLVRLWLPVVAWAAVIFVFSSIPDLGTGLGGTAGAVSLSLSARSTP